ncbi:MAG: GGDEF domain-containing protein [Chloroflexi bacterium]|uniref:GGDEF domain-containing protein n=1 Tax=Candidatus Chlorohelix allophototropha TaxID=3003348 RepID=A0A8T7M836_9CHLR|nr:GGDEF domain-containing protein [Chloroflexota bacterium]WJW68147.1 GGDEF domain-containing protein [Chloroflexota bacterium L227-S17]
MFGKEEFYRIILDNLFDGVYLVGKDKRITYWNKGATRITGYDSETVIGRKCSENLLMHVSESGTLLCITGCPISETITDGAVREAEVFLHHSDGHRVPVLVRVAPLVDEEGNIIGAVESFSDNSITIQERKRANNFQKEAMEDALTGIGNRRFIEHKFRFSLGEAQQLGDQIGVLLIDIDYFKKVNDNYGHDIGDQVLKMVAKTIANNVRVTDFVGRWGGEEFVVVLHNMDQERLIAISEKIRALVGKAQLHTLHGEIKVTISIGAALNSTNDTPDSLFERIDKLLYQSKSEGRNRVSYS